MIIKLKGFSYISQLNNSFGGVIILDVIKEVLNIVDDDNSKNFIISYIIEDVSQYILNYCNLKFIPAELFFTFVNMCVYKYKYITNSYNSNVKSITEGDVSISFSNIDNKEVFSSFFNELNRFRKIY